MVQDFYFLVLTQVLLSGTHFGHLWSVGLWRQWRFTAATKPWFSDTSAWEAVEVHKRKLYNLRWHWFTLKVNFFLSNSCSITYVKKNQTNVKVADFESFPVLWISVNVAFELSVRMQTSPEILKLNYVLIVLHYFSQSIILEPTGQFDFYYTVGVCWASLICTIRDQWSSGVHYSEEGPG